MLPNSRERQVLSLAGLLGIVLSALIIVRRKSIPQDQINLLKELQEQVKTQNEIINQQAEKQQKIEAGFQIDVLNSLSDWLIYFKPRLDWFIPLLSKHQFENPSEQMPWYRQMYNMNISRPVTITTHVS